MGKRQYSTQGTNQNKILTRFFLLWREVDGVAKVGFNDLLQKTIHIRIRMSRCDLKIHAGENDEVLPLHLVPQLKFYNTCRK